MHVYRKYRVPVSLTAGQKSDVLRLQDGQRHAYNWAASHIKDGWDLGDEYGLSVKFTPYRKSAGEWMRSVPRVFQNIGIQDAFKAAKMAIRHGRGSVRYRTRKQSRRAALKCALPPRVVDRHMLKLPRFATIRANIPNEIMVHEPRSYEFVRTRRGGYMLYVSCLVKVDGVRLTGMTHKGIDRGTVEPTVVATLAPDGRPLAKDSYDTASAFRDNRAWNQKMRSKASKMNKRSGRYRRHLRRLNAKMRKIMNRRTYAECVAAKHIVCDGRPGTITFEDLRLSKMIRAGGAHKRDMNREMRFVRHHAIEQRIKNRAEVEGVTIKYARPHYTSQTCSQCGHVDKKSRVTRDMFKCTSCNHIQHADVNAAINIGREGMLLTDMIPSIPPEAGTAFVRRELDARRSVFAGSYEMREPSIGAIPAPRGRRKASKVDSGRQVTNLH